jgi:hypothetical protein
MEIEVWADGKKLEGVVTADTVRNTVHMYAEPAVIPGTGEWNIVVRRFSSVIVRGTVHPDELDTMTERWVNSPRKSLSGIRNGLRRDASERDARTKKVHTPKSKRGGAWLKKDQDDAAADEPDTRDP